jgi:probable H4MPT-linked C1 transfer pathway protein
MVMARPERVIGWDVGGAHVKAALVEHGELRDAAQWPCPLWQGMEHLQQALDAAALRWPEALASPQTVHAITMTGEMVDLFPHREAGVVAIAAFLEQALAGPTIFYAGESAWFSAAELATRWDAVGSVNWLATAQLAARELARHGGIDGGVLVDIGSTTADLIALQGARARPRGRSDADRLVTGELVYQGVVRTPLCALGPRVAFQGLTRNVMNEFFATTADVYRLTGELDAEHDQHPAADGAGKDAAATRQRLARMIGLDARDAPDDDWWALAREWRELQLLELRGQLQRVLDAAGSPHGREAAALPPRTPLVAAGCGDFLVAALAEALQRPMQVFSSCALGEVAEAEPVGLQSLRRRVQLAAPACAVALLYGGDGA